MPDKSPAAGMRHARTRLLSFCLLALVFGWTAAAPPAEARAGKPGRSNAVPRIFEPGETVTPKPGMPVRFRWSTEALAGDTQRYDQFRLFKGNQAYADFMIHDAEVPTGQGWIQIPSELIADPGVYCWTVKRIGVRGQSRAAFSIFKSGDEL